MNIVTLFRSFDGLLYDSAEECAMHERFMIRQAESALNDAKERYEKSKSEYERMVKESESTT